MPATMRSVLSLICLLAPVTLARFTAIGCFSSPGDLIDMGPHVFQSPGLCYNKCLAIDQPVIGFVNGTNCLCGNTLPPAETRVDDSECNLPCPGYIFNICKSDIAGEAGSL